METLKNKFINRFVESGRLLSLVENKKQRVTGKKIDCSYIALYNPIEDRWALTLNKEAGYPCYGLDDKGEPIAIYIDKIGNIRERGIKQKIFDEVLNTSLSSENFREQLKEAQSILKEKYSTEFIKPSLGYDLENLPYSCQKGKGHFFKWLDPLAEMLLLRNNKGEIVGRCLVWHKDNIKHNGEHINNNIADRLYYNEGDGKIALKIELKKLGIESMWEQQGDGERPFRYKEFTLHLPENIKEALDKSIENGEVPFLDTFNHYNQYDGILNSWHWSDRLDHEYYEWDDNITQVLLGTGGYPIIQEDETWDNYNECYIDPENAVEPLNYDGVTHIDNCIYSQYHDGFLLDDGDIIAVNCDNGYDDYDYTYMGSGVELIEIDGKIYFLDNVRRYRA